MSKLVDNKSKPQVKASTLFNQGKFEAKQGAQLQNCGEDAMREFGLHAGVKTLEMTLGKYKSANEFYDKALMIHEATDQLKRIIGKKREGLEGNIKFIEKHLDKTQSETIDKN